MAGGTLEGNLNGVFGVISQFNLPMSSASDVVQTLGLMTERTAAQFPDLINSLSYIGPLAETMGIKFEDVVSGRGQEAVSFASTGDTDLSAQSGDDLILVGICDPDSANRLISGSPAGARPRVAGGLGPRLLKIPLPPYRGGHPPARRAAPRGAGRARR